MQQDSEEVMLASEQWFLCYSEQENMNYGKLVDLIGTVLKTNSADVLRKHPKVVKECLKAGEYVFNDCKLKYRPNWNARMNAIYLGPVTGQPTREERRKNSKELEQYIEQYMKTHELGEEMDFS